MVKKIVKFFAYMLFFLSALVVFSPKSSLYYFGEQQFKKFGVIISDEKLEETLSSLNIENLDISTKEIDTALIQEADITLLLVYNSVKFTKIKLSSLVESYLPSKIDSLDITYTIFNPFYITADGIGEFGEASAEVSLLDRNASVVLKPSKKMLSKYKKSLKMFKKSKNGEYVYAKTF